MTEIVDCPDLNRSCPCRVGGWRCSSFEQMCECEAELEEEGTKKPEAPPIRVIRDTRSKPDSECFFFWNWLCNKLRG